jgi:hypothetical protein
MFLSISNLDNNTFPQNLRLEMSIYTDNINSNELSFSINMKVFDQIVNPTQPYDISFVGSYFFDIKKLLVSEKCRHDFKDEFYFNGKVLIPELFTKYILPKLSY